MWRMDIKSNAFDSSVPPNIDKQLDTSGVSSIQDLRIVIIRNILLESQYENFTAQETAQIILSMETVDFSTEGEFFFNYVWDRFGFDVYRAMLRIVREQLPTIVLSQILNSSIRRFNKLGEQINVMQVRIFYIP